MIINWNLFYQKNIFLIKQESKEIKGKDLLKKNNFLFTIYLEQFSKLQNLFKKSIELLKTKEKNSELDLMIISLIENYMYLEFSFGNIDHCKYLGQV